MWPVHAVAALAVASLAIAAVLGYLQARSAAIAAVVLSGVLSVVGVAAYALTEAQYQACVDGKGIAEGSSAAVEGRHWCRHRVFAVRGDTVHLPPAVRDGLADLADELNSP